MPTYEYQCLCGLRFDGRSSLEDRSKAKTCPSCEEQAAPVVPSQVHGHFNHEVTGPGPQNSGIQGLDAHIDRVIGQSAKQGRDVINQRVHDKRQILANNPGLQGKDLSKNLDGSYRVLKPEERDVHDRSQNIHKTAMGIAAKNWSR